jgi:hypothetical protein
LRFTTESGQQVLVRSKVFGKKLERDETAKARIFGLENYSHPAAPELLDNPVM